MLEGISYYTVLGFPLVGYLGFLTIALLLATAALGLLMRRGRATFKWHRRVAIATVVSALVHGTLAALAYV